MERTKIEARAQQLLSTSRSELGLPATAAAAVQTGSAEGVTTVESEPSYWLVPLFWRDRLAGFIRLSLDGDLLAFGRFGTGEDLPPASWLSPQHAQAALEAAAADRFTDLSPPQLVHDGPMQRLAWLARGSSEEHGPVLLFWAFGDTYWRPEEQPPQTGMAEDD